MIFRLKILKGGAFKTWYLDNSNNALYNEYRDLLNIPSKLEAVSLSTKDYNANDYSNIQTIVFHVGNKCNYRCKYCPELAYKGFAHNANPADIPLLIDRLKKVDLSKVEEIMISGGEPLAYWDAVKELILPIKQLCPNLKNFRMVTNGELLTDEIVDDCYKKQFKIVVSDDGGDNRYRHQRSKQHTIERYSKYNQWAKKLGTNFVIRYQLGRHHQDAIAMYDYFKQAIPNIQSIADHHVIETVMPQKDLMTESMVFFDTLTKDQLRLISDSRYQILLDNKPELHNTRKKLNNLIRSFTQGLPITTQYTCQNADKTAVHLDFAGNVLRCMWVPDKNNKLGKLDEADDVYNFNFNSWQERKYCYRCPLLQFCKGVCSLADQYTIDQSCSLYYADKLAYFKAILKKVYDVDLYSIEPIDGAPIKSCAMFNDYLSNYNSIKDKVNWKFDPWQ